MAETETPYEPPPAAGDDYDSRIRAAKTGLAAAESTGDDDAAGKARADLQAVVKERAAAEAKAERAAAAQARRAAGTEQDKEPAGRSAPKKSQA